VKAIHAHDQKVTSIEPLALQRRLPVEESLRATVAIGRRLADAVAAARASTPEARAAALDVVAAAGDELW
jgi:hypothetical protein